TMTPLPFHVPPRPAASVKVVINPLAISIRFSLPPAKKPIARLSGDQNGNAALSVPLSGCASWDCKERSHRLDVLAPATKTIFRPSGEIENDVRSELAGVSISTRISGNGDRKRSAHRLTPMATNRANANASQATRSRRDDPFVTAAIS